MRTNKTRICANVLLIMVVALMLSCSCNDKPTEPKPEEGKNYVFYFHEGHQPGYIFAYHPITNHIDSFWLPVSMGFNVSADGKYLYAKHEDSTYSAVYLLDSISNGDTLQIDHMLPFYYIKAVSPDNRFLAVEHNGLNIVRTSDYSIVFQDTSSFLVNGTFTTDGNRYYGGELHVDLQGTPEIIRRWSCPYGLLHDFVPSEDESIWYFIVCYYGPNFYFVAYEHELDSVLYSQYMTPGFGRIKIAPDGKVLFTNPGTGPVSVGPFPPAYFHAYDPETNTANDTIWTLNECSQIAATPIGEIAFSPDGQWLVGIHSGFGEILTYNLVTKQYSKCCFLGNNHSLRNLSCRQIP